MTARLATHPDVASRAADVLERLDAAGVDVEVVSRPGAGGLGHADLLHRLGESSLDLALVGIQTLRGTVTDDLTLLAVPPREDPRDVLVAITAEPAPLRSLPPGSRVAVSGPRRLALLRAHRPDLHAVVVAEGSAVEISERDGSLAAVILGVGEARGAGLAARTSEVLDPKSWLPEPGQGTVALMARHPIAEVTALDHLPTRTALRAELALLDTLDPPPGTALGSLAQPSGRLMRLWAAVASSDGRRLVRVDLTGPLDEPELLGASVARELARRGADLVFAGAES